MGAFSDYLEDKIVEHFMRNGSVASPAVVYLALFESDPGEGSGGTETAYTGYARQASTWTAFTAGATENEGSITFPPNTGSAVTITHAVVYDAVTVGNRLIHGVLGASKILETSDVLSFADGAVVLGID